MATIGLDKLFYSKITEDEDGSETYATPVSLAKAMTAELSVELAEATLYADDGAAEVVKEFQSGTLTLGVDDIGAAAASDLTGAVIDQNGVIISASEDGGAPVAIGFRAKKANGKVIGVDTDQAATINKLGTEGMTVTSAMKGLGATVKATLKDVIENGNWANYGGKIATLGLVSGDDPELNYVQLPMESTQWTDNFTKDDYKALVKSMFDGTVKVSDDTSAMPAHSIIVNEYDNIM